MGNTSEPRRHWQNDWFAGTKPKVAGSTPVVRFHESTAMAGFRVCDHLLRTDGADGFFPEDLQEDQDGAERAGGVGEALVGGE
jgi:hypothetical protein